MTDIYGADYSFKIMTIKKAGAADHCVMRLLPVIQFF